MGLALLVGAAASAMLAGFLQGRQSVLWFYIALPFALGAVVAHVFAAGWPFRRFDPAKVAATPDGLDHDNDPRHAGLLVRVVFGLIVGGLGLVAGFSYGENHLAWFGDRVAAEVTDIREECGQNMTRCATGLRVAVDGDDLGWARTCGTYESVGGTIEVIADPIGWIRPESSRCGVGQGPGRTLLGLWLTGLGVIVLVRVGGWFWLRLTGR